MNLSTNKNADVVVAIEAASNYSYTKNEIIELLGEPDIKNQFQLQYKMFDTNQQEKVLLINFNNKNNVVGYAITELNNIKKNACPPCLCGKKMSS